MEKPSNNIFFNPTKKAVIIITILWVISNFLLLISITDLFTESFFQKKYVMIYFLMLGSTVAVVKLHRNYWKCRSL